MYAFRVFALALALALSSSAALAAGDHGLEEVLIESASTPAQHEALAAYFRGEAAAARKEAKQHPHRPRPTAGRSS